MAQIVDTSQRLAKQSAALSAFAARWSALVPADSDLDTGFRRLSERLGAVPWRSVLHFAIRDGGRSQSWSLQIGPDGAHVHSGRLEAPDVEVLTDAGTWREIVSGSLSPLSAFGGGRMRFLGDVKAARRVAGRLAAGGEG
jgi:hypothetical protein